MLNVRKVTGMRLIDADAFDKTLSDAQAECKRNGGNFRFGVLSNVRENLRMMPTVEQERIWIPVSERTPEDGSDILVYCDDGEESRIVACNYDNGVWFDCVFNTVMVFKNITHWMPLPEPPKVD